MHQVDKYLNRERFNETILSILKFDIPVISFTSSDGRIQDEECFFNTKKLEKM